MCGLPDTKPLWIDYGAPALGHLFGRPGVIVAGSGEGYPAQMRSRGAQTIHWDNYLRSRVGTPSAPADPDVLRGRADRVFDFAVLTTGCATPWIAVNELFGASVPTPWTPTTTRYRQNVLEWVRLLAARGAKPLLLVSSDPFTGGEAAQWWRDVAAVADIVIEKYFNAPAVHRAGPVLGSRRMRTSMRQAASKLFAINIPPSKLGFMLAFQTRPGSGGRGEPEAGVRLVRGRQAAGAGSEAGRTRALDRPHLVVGLGRLQRGREQPGQTGRGVRLALGA